MNRLAPLPRSIFRLFVLAACALVLAGCEPDEDQGPGAVRERVDRTAPTENPIAESPNTPFGVPPFHRIRAEHFLPALEQALEGADERVAEIAGNSADPDFENTVLALEQSGRDVARIARLWYGLVAVGDDEAADPDQEAFTRLLGEHQRRVLHDRDLFERIEQVREGEQMQALGPQQRRLVDETYRRFLRAGAHLAERERNELAEIDRRIDELDHRYARTRRSATHRHELLIEDEERLEGLPESLVTLARRSALDRGHSEGWVFTLHAHSFYPFMRHFPGREERRELYRAWMTRYEDLRRNDEDLGRLIERLADLRAQRAQILGHASHIDFLLDDATIDDRAELDALLETLTDAARDKAREETRRLQALAAEDGIEGTLEPWDWWYYRERLIESDLADDAEPLRPFLEIGQVQDGLFNLANRLWGLTFHPRSELPGWHMDTSAFEVRDAGGSTLGIVYFDLIHREGKQGGAWTSHYRLQGREGDERIQPVTAVIANVSPPAAGMPALLSAQQARTVFHEFGHALHALLSDVDHAALAGTNVPPDFVEFPALLLERFSVAPEILRSYARHHETGEQIDDDGIRALQRRAELTSGLETIELLAAIELDLALHGAEAGEVPDLETAEERVRERLDLPAMISPRHHGGGLASLFASQRRGGDFRTLWSEMLAADAFAAFEEAGLTNQALAVRLREEVLSRGNARDPMESWREFRGRDPEVRFLLEARGLQDAANTPSGE
ncbi:M3 family metallopeptidase [Wenzhouxiangella sp. EGI_FJ10409]|uniref:M3 family metallopeptidase n=1 Tax=Wenzhouxiangella sp. EGI_FJ10409 TaxID=3243767 RepID=UPI0035D54691